MLDEKNKPIKSIQWGNFQLTEWEKPYQDKTIKSFSLACRVFNKETGKSETESNLQIDRKQDMSIIKFLLKKALSGKVTTFASLNQYSIEEDSEQELFYLKKKYITKDNEEKYSILVIKYQHDLLHLIDLLERCIALFVTPIKSKKTSGATNIASKDNDFDEVMDSDIPF